MSIIVVVVKKIVTHPMFIAVVTAAVRELTKRYLPRPRKGG
jgi:hypothetical protein